MGARAGDPPAPHPLPVAAHARRHDRQRLPGVPAGHPQHRFRHPGRRGHRPHRRGQRHRLPPLPRADPRAGGPREDPPAGGDPPPGGDRPGLRHHAGAVRRHPAGPQGGADPHLVHPLGLPHPLVGAAGGDAGPGGAPRAGARRGRADGGRLDGGAGPVRGAEPARPGLRQHPRRLGRLRLHPRAAGGGLRPGLRAAAQHVGLLQRPDLRRGLPRDALGVRPEARPALAEALGAHLLRLLRAAGPQDRAAAAHPESAQALRELLVRSGTGGAGGGPRLRALLQALPGGLRRRGLEPRAGARGPREAGRPGRRRGPRRGPERRADHEGRLHRALPAAAAVGLGGHRHGRGTVRAGEARG